MTTLTPRRAPEFEQDRVFFPGGIWFYVKLYTDTELLTDLASRHLPSALAHLFGISVYPPPVDQAPNDPFGSGRLWFFVRYTDSGHHLRVRIRFDQAEQSHDALSALWTWGEKLRVINFVSRIELGTYEQETYRYGGPGNIDRAERVFAVDSADCIKLLTGPYRGGDTVAQMARRVADMWVTAADPDVHCAAVNGKMIAQKYVATYEEKAAAVRLHRGREEPSSDSIIGHEVGRYFRGLQESGISTQRRIYIARSLAHMHCNRAGATASTELRALEAATSIVRSLDR